MPVDKETVNTQSPDSQTVNDFHRFADTDSRTEAIHHTLGLTHAQAAFGDHNHRYGNGVPLLDGTTFTLSRSANLQAVLKQMIDALVLLGATDNTTA